MRLYLRNTELIDKLDINVIEQKEATRFFQLGLE